MTTSKKSQAASQARTAAARGVNVRDRIRSVAADALKDGKLTMKQVSGVVNDVMEGAAAGIRESVPSSPASVLRQVFDGLNEGVEAAAKSGRGAFTEARQRGEKLLRKDAPAAAKKAREANGHFLDAVSGFAGKLSGEMRAELDDLVARARRTGPKIAGSAQKAARAADGRLMELTSETARSGVRVARRAVGGLMMAAGGLLEGLAEGIEPKPMARSRPAHKPSAKKKAAAKKAPAKKAGKKTRSAPKRKASKR